MKRCLLFVLLLLTVWPAAAQENAYTWESYPFTVQLPAGWTAAPDGDRLALGAGKDASAAVKGVPPAGPVVVVQVVEPSAKPEDGLRNFAPSTQPDIQSASYGSATWLTLALKPTAGYQGALILVNDTYLVTASAPVDQWEAFQPTLDKLIGSIQAQPAEREPAQRLTQRIAWHGVSFDAPENWTPNWAGSDNLLWASTQAERLYRATNFRARSLGLEIRDLSPMRAMLGPASVADFDTLYYKLKDTQFGPVTNLTVQDIPASQVDFENLSGAGRVVLLLTPRRAFLVVGMAGQEEWAASEKALFEAVLATLKVE